MERIATLNISGLLSPTKVSVRFAKFCAIEVLGALVSQRISYFVTNLEPHSLISGIVATEISFLFNFSISRAWSFRNEASSSGVFKFLKKNHLVRSPGIPANLLSLWLFGVPWIPISRLHSDRYEAPDHLGFCRNRRMGPEEGWYDRSGLCGTALSF